MCNNYAVQLCILCIWLKVCNGKCSSRRVKFVIPGQSSFNRVNQLLSTVPTKTVVLWRGRGGGGGVRPL